MPVTLWPMKNLLPAIPLPITELLIGLPLVLVLILGT
jgi:hypothetical protein